MIEFALALSVVIVGGFVALAVWDMGRRALDAQVEQARLRVEATKRIELEAIAVQLAELRAQHNSLEHSIAIGRRGR